MSDETQKAYEAASRAAHAIVRSAVESIMGTIQAGEVTDQDDLHDRIHEEADNACMYTADCYALVWGLPNEEDAIEEGLCSDPSDFNAVLTAQAYCNVRAAIACHADEFEAALEVAEDARLAEGES